MEKQWFSVQIINDVDDDDGVYLTTASYTMEDCRKDYEDMILIIPAHIMVQWWVFVIGDEPAVRISYSIELKTQCRFRVFTKCTHTCNAR